MGDVVQHLQIVETVSHPLYLLKGNFQCQNRCVPYVISDIPAQCFQTRSNISVASILYKALVPLTEGVNHVTVSCPHKSLMSNVCLLSPNIKRPYVKAIYVVFGGHDGSFQTPHGVPSNVDSACKRIGLALRLLQTATAETIFAETGEKCTFACAGDVKDDPQTPFPYKTASPCSCAVWCINSSLQFQEAQHLEPKKLWESVGRDLCRIFPEDINRVKWLAIVSCTRYQIVVDSEQPPALYEDIISQTAGHCALGSAGLALIGSGTLFTWPVELSGLGAALSDDRPIDRRKYMDDSAYR